MTKSPQAIAERIIAAYKERYDFPPQGESHMRDCIVDELSAKIVSNVPNLDAMNPAELKEFWLRYRNGWPHKEIFPRGGPGTIRTLRQLAAYADLKRTAIQNRTAGYIADAQRAEAMADQIYQNLPDWATLVQDRPIGTTGAM